MTVTGMLILACCVLIGVGAYMLGYARGVDAGYDRTISFIEDKFPEAYAVIVREVDNR